MDTGSYSSLNVGGNPLSYIFDTTLCYVISGVVVLVVGVIITSLTFQNLDPYHEGNRARFAGPVLIVAGILIMGRGAFYKIQQYDCTALLNRHQNLCRRLFRVGLHASGLVQLLATMSASVCAGLHRIASNANRINHGDGAHNTGQLFVLHGSNLACSPHLMLGLSLTLLAIGCMTTFTTYYSYRTETYNHLALTGPLLCLLAGLLTTGRVLYKLRQAKLRERRTECQANVEAVAEETGSQTLTPPPDDNRSLSQPNSPSQRHREEDEQAIYLEPTSPESPCPYSDEPPSYSQVTENGRVGPERGVIAARWGAVVNPALEADDSPSPPPPPYEECKHITQTTL